MYDKLERLSLKLVSADLDSRPFLGFGLFLGLTAALLSTVLLLVGQYLVTLYPVDAMYALAQGDYLAKGWRPYVDYYSFHGPFPAIFTALAIGVHGISLNAIVLSQVLAAAMLGPLMWKAASSRLHWIWAVLLGLSVELLLVSCTPLGRKSWREFTPAMWYNSLGFCLLGILFLYTLLPSRSPSRMSRWIDSAIAAFCLSGIFFTKMSFFAPALVVFVAGAIVAPRGTEMRVHGLAALLMSVVLVFGFAWALGASISGYLEFLQSIAMRVHPLAFALRYLHYTRTLGVLLIGMVLICALIQEAGLWRQTRREWMLTILMTGALTAIVGTCKQDPESLPLLGVVPLGFAVIVGALARQAGRPVSGRLALPLVILSGLLIVNDSKNSALSLAFAHMRINTLEAPVERLPDASSQARNLPLGESVDPELFDNMPKDWVEDAFAALELLRDAGAPSTAVLFVATDANGITPLTRLQHTRGESPWVPFAWAGDPKDVPPPVNNYLEDADLILRDLRAQGCWENLTHFRGAFVEENFSLVASHEHWSLYARRQNSADNQNRRAAALSPR